MRIYILIPRFSNSGGNLVALKLASKLQVEGHDIQCFSGFTFRRPKDVFLITRKKGILNSLINVVSFFTASIFSCFVLNVIATHHLTAIFNFIRPARYALVQDVESDFYPKKFAGIGRILWNNYLRSRVKIYTNKFLEERITQVIPLCEGLSFVELVNNDDNDFFDDARYDVLMVLRDGEYKNPSMTISCFEYFSSKGISVRMINSSSINYENTEVESACASAVSREQFIHMLNNTRVFVCLSKWEGLGLPNLEAYMCGCHIVSTPIPSALFLHELSPVSVSLCSPDNLVDIYNSVDNVLSQSAVDYDSVRLLAVASRKAVLNQARDLWLKYALSSITHPHF